MPASNPQLFDGNPQPMWVYDLETLHFLAANDAAVAMYGYSRADFLAMTTVDIRPPEDVSRLMENSAQEDSGLDRARIWRHCLKDGQIIQVEIKSYALHTPGRRTALVMGQDVTDQIRAEQALKQSEERYRQFVELLPQLIWNTDAWGHNTYVSPRMGEYIGLPTEQLMHLDWQQVIHPDDLKQVHRRWMESVNMGQPYGTEYRLRRADGVYRWHLVQAVRIEQEQGPQWLGMSTDIDDRKQAELALQDLNHSLVQTIAERTAELQKSQAELRAILNNSPANIYVEDPAGRYRFVNQAFLNLWNCQPKDVLGKTIHEFFPSHIADALRDNDQLLEQEVAQQFEEILRVNGEEWVFLSHKFLLRDDQSEVYALCDMSTDITDRKAMESALQASRDRMQATLAALPDIVLRVDQTRRYLDFHASNYIEEMTGLDNLVGRTMAEVLPPEMAQDRLQQIERVLHRQTVEVYEQQIQLDGEQRYEELRVAPGGDSEAVFVIRDITARKQTEIQLNRQLAAIEAAMDSIAILQDNAFLYLNRAYLEIFGYTHPEELMGQPWTRLYSPEEQARLGQEIFPVLARHGAWSGEVIALRKDGTTFDQGVSLTRIGDGLVICVGEDISESKAAERALQASQSLLQTVLEMAPVAIFWKDRQGVYQGANPKTAEIFGLTSTADVIHRSHDQLVWPPDVLDIIRAEDRQILATGEPYLNIVQQVITTTGREIWLDL